jgi:hypothetical protein
MNLFHKLIENLQHQSYQTRVKILWAAVIGIGALLVIIWFISLKSNISNLGTNSLTDFRSPEAEQPNQITAIATDLIKIEYIEQSISGFKIFFNISNRTNDILNFPQIHNITLTVEDRPYNPKQILDRQNNKFVQKVLSNTQNFGILVFDHVEGDEGDLVIENLSFEQSLGQTLKQEITLNFEELRQQTEVRN